MDTNQNLMDTNQNLIAHSLCYHPTINNTTYLENSNRAIFPGSFCEKLFETCQNENQNENENENINQQILFKIDGEDNVKSVYVTPHEFSAQENFIYLPRSVMNTAFIKEGDIVKVSQIFLPKVSKILLQPITNIFAETIDDPKSALEKVITEKYPVLSLGDEICFDKYELIIKKLEPNDTVSTYESDPTVEFLPSIEQEALDKKEKKRLEDELAIKNQIENKKKMEELEKIKKERPWKAFQGEGRTISGNIFNFDNINNNNKNLKPKILRKIKKKNYALFSGKGNKLC